MGGGRHHSLAGLTRVVEKMAVGVDFEAEETHGCPVGVEQHPRSVARFPRMVGFHIQSGKVARLRIHHRIDLQPSSVEMSYHTIRYE